MSKDFRYGLDQLTVKAALQIARNQRKGILVEEVKTKVQKSHSNVQTILERAEPVYSINTGFGSLCTTRISSEDSGKLQENLLMSHSVGVGDPIPKEIAKLMLILKVQSLCYAYSGISLGLIERICWFIDHDYTPHVPEQGSVGASGDLAPLAHLFLPLLGLGKLTGDGQNYLPTAEVFQQHKLEPFSLGAKEGLALINGTQFIAAHAVKVVERLQNCLDYADLIGALSIEALLGSSQPFVARLHQLRPHPGAVTVAGRMEKFLKGSGFVDSHKNCERVQDPYSLRCIPQVHGASRDALTHLQDRLLCELNSVTDNPIIFSAEDSISGGNFHGQPLALPLDYATLAASEVGNISDRRSYLLMEGQEGLPPYLVKKSGLNSGFMITQYCSAALASENKSLCFPASADSIPTSMGQEDHVSMGSISGRKALQVIGNVENVLAIELLCAAQAFDFRRPLKSSEAIEIFHKAIRQKIPFVEEDTVLSEYIQIAREIVVDHNLIHKFS